MKINFNSWDDIERKFNEIFKTDYRPTKVTVNDETFIKLSKILLVSFEQNIIENRILDTILGEIHILIDNTKENGLFLE